MRNFRSKLIEFMYGRNGIDSLNRFIFFLYLILTLAYWISSILISPILSAVISLILLGLMFCLMFRCMSRNIYARQAENRRYLAVKSGISSFFRLQGYKIRDRHTHIYKKCPKCKAVLRLKKIKGSHKAVCPRCSYSFNVKV